jgi:NADH-quinone oxidoreductase subunit N
MLAITIRRSRLLAVMVTLLGLAASFALLFVAREAAPCRVTPLLTVDTYALYYFGLLIAASAVVAVLAYGYLGGRNGHSDEFYLLLLFAILSVSLYAMIAYFRTGERSLEAGVKYLILAAVSSAFLLFGMALVYAQTGSMALELMKAPRPPVDEGSGLILLAGLALMMVGVGFKLALVPFHMWTPDVYEGAPSPVTAYVATASKGAMVALLVRLAAGIDIRGYHLYELIAVLAAASIIAGNLLALLQDNIKRLLAYSSIAHLGYVLVAFLAGGARGGEAVAFYLAAYFVTMLGAFGVITVLSGKERDLDRLKDFQGMGRSRPFLAGLFTAMVLSLAGIPLTAGFVGKFLVLSAGVNATLWTLAVILVLGSVVSIFYYLRVVVAMYMRPADREGSETHRTAISLAGGAILAALLLALLWLGVWPAPLLDVIRSTVGSLF